MNAQNQCALFTNISTTKLSSASKYSCPEIAVAPFFLLDKLGKISAARVKSDKTKDKQSFSNITAD